MYKSMALQLFLAAATHAIPNARVARSDITDCLDASSVPQVLPGTADFTQAIKPFNLRLPFTPVAVAVPTTTAQVQAAVACGVKLGITVSPKSGGHSYASHGLGGEDGHLMVDMKYWNTVALDNSTGIATISPGSRLGNVAQALYAQGSAAISHGTCPGVGIGGHVLHGGYGYSSHTHGLALDNLISADLVLANGSLATTSKALNSDLFWALRGAGSSYGIVTSLKFQTYKAPENNTVFSYGFNWNETQARNGFAVLQDYANTTAPLELNLRLFVNPYSISVIGVYYGSQAEFKVAFAPVLAKLGTPRSTSISTRSWLDTLKVYAYDPLTQPIDYDNHETFFAKSLMTISVDEAAITAFWSYWTRVAKSYIDRDWYVTIDIHGGPHSAITRVPADETSYAHRSALLKYEFYDRTSETYPADGFDFLNGWVATITDTMKDTKYSPFGMYINYADTTLNAEEAHTHYWLSHYDKLAAIKKTYDPNSVFSNPQAIARK